MKTQSLLVAATLFVTVGVASAQNEPSQDTMRAPTGVESTAPNNPPVATFRRLQRTPAVRPHHRRADRLLTCPGRWALRWTVQGTRKHRLTVNKSDKR